MTTSQKNARKIMSMTTDSNCSPKDLVKAIESDPIMTTKILEVANSSFFSLPGSVDSVQDASVHLGLNTVKNLAISIAMLDSQSRQDHINA